MPYNKGDLVHIPQSVTLIASDDYPGVAQLTIPLRIKKTKAPAVGVGTAMCEVGDYLTVYCEGDEWTVKSGSVYSLGGLND